MASKHVKREGMICCRREGQVSFHVACIVFCPVTEWMENRGCFLLSGGANGLYYG